MAGLLSTTNLMIGGAALLGAYLFNIAGFKDWINGLGGQDMTGFIPADDEQLLAQNLGLGVSEFPIERYNPYEPAYFGTEPEAYPLNYDVGVASGEY